ncbi:MAG: PepSY-like domain-containing protein [Muribaculaceae bacterium]|nr:PepSY-like domain-containing protein [Muribaculaceae bacterium]
MKKLILSLLVALLGFGAAYADKYTIDRDQLPEEAQKMLTEHFPKSKVAMIKVDKHLLKKTDYDVKLVNGTKIEFNNAGKWTSVDCKTREVPSSLILRPIRNYVAKNFPDVKIVKIEKNLTNFEVDLSDGVEIKFDRLGNFKGMDMD